VIAALRPIVQREIFVGLVPNDMNRSRFCTSLASGTVTSRATMTISCGEWH
jgi:hypothetical protein